MITPRKALYETGSGRGIIESCVALRCDSVILTLGGLGDAKIAAAQAAGIRVWLYGGGPEFWTPGAWRGTLAAIDAAIVRYPSILGPVADAEGPMDRPAPDGWGGDTTSEANALADALEARARAGRSVGFTSYPSWKHRAVIARRAPSVWGSPQLYGVRSGFPSIATIRGWGDPWRALFPGPRYVPSLAGWGWGMPGSPMTFPQYLAAMSSEPAGIFWRIPGQGCECSFREGEPCPCVRTTTDADLRALAAWQPGARPSSSGGGGVVGGLLALIALAAAARWVMR